MNRAQQKMLEERAEARGREQGCVHLSWELEGKTVQKWDVERNAPEPHEPAFKVVRVYQARTRGYLILDLEVGGRTKSHVTGFTTGNFYKVVG